MWSSSSKHLSALKRGKRTLQDVTAWLAENTKHLTSTGLLMLMWSGRMSVGGGGCCAFFSFFFFFNFMVVYEPTAIPKEYHRSMFSHKVFYLTRLTALAKWGHPTPAVTAASFRGSVVTFDLLLETCIFHRAPSTRRRKSATSKKIECFMLSMPFCTPQSLQFTVDVICS